jgi:hypothetical protein
MPGAVDQSPESSSIETIVPGSAYKFVTGTLQQEDLCSPGSLLQGKPRFKLHRSDRKRYLALHLGRATCSSEHPGFDHRLAD